MVRDSETVVAEIIGSLGDFDDFARFEKRAC